MTDTECKLLAGSLIDKYKQFEDDKDQYGDKWIGWLGLTAMSTMRDSTLEDCAKVFGIPETHISVECDLDQKIGCVITQGDYTKELNELYSEAARRLGYAIKIALQDDPHAGGGWLLYQYRVYPTMAQDFDRDSLDVLDI